MLSRQAKLPINIPTGIDVEVNGSHVIVKGSKGQLQYLFNDTVKIIKDGSTITLQTNDDSKFSKALSGTIHALIKNMLLGVSVGFQKKLIINGVGYRANLQGNKLNMSLGYSHPIVYEAPQGIKIEVPSATEVLISGCNKEVVGEVAAKIRRFRAVEPYKGKGIRYADETVILKETKKK